MFRGSSIGRCWLATERVDSKRPDQSVSDGFAGLVDDASGNDASTRQAKCDLRCLPCDNGDRVGCAIRSNRARTSTDTR